MKPATAPRRTCIEGTAKVQLSYGPLFLTAFVALSGVAATAQPSGPTLGCFERDYSTAHLAQNPRQIVARMVLNFEIDASGSTEIGRMAVWTANQGRLKGSANAGRRFDQFLICWNDETSARCAVECDGGSMRITRDSGKILQFSTSNLWVGETEGCGGAVDLAEIKGQTVSYRLNRADDALCSDVFDRDE